MVQRYDLLHEYDDGDNGPKGEIVEDPTGDYVRFEDYRKVADLVLQAEELAKKFVNKVDNGQARSQETYADCRMFLAGLRALREERVADWGKPK